MNKQHNSNKGQKMDRMGSIHQNEQTLMCSPLLPLIAFGNGNSPPYHPGSSVCCDAGAPFSLLWPVVTALGQTLPTMKFPGATESRVWPLAPSPEALGQAEQGGTACVWNSHPTATLQNWAGESRWLANLTLRLTESLKNQLIAAEKLLEVCEWWLDLSFKKESF